MRPAMTDVNMVAAPAVLKHKGYSSDEIHTRNVPNLDRDPDQGDHRGRWSTLAGVSTRNR